jgi:ribonuclease HI
MKPIIIFTDGSASTKNLKGGCGSFILEGNKEHLISKGFYPTRTGRMEITAVLLSLQSINNKSRNIVIYSDSQYVINSIMKGWIYKWEKKNWGNVKNIDLWKKMLIELRLFNKSNGSVKLYHVKGHQNNLNDFLVNGNNCADLLANYKNFNNFSKDLKFIDLKSREQEIFRKQNFENVTK